MTIVHLCYSIGGTYGGDDSSYGAAAAQADWEADYVVEFAVDEDATPAEPPVLRPLRVRDDIPGAQWETWEDQNRLSGTDTCEIAVARREYEVICRAFQVASEELYPLAPSERLGVWHDACEQWARDNTPVQEE